MFRLFRWNLHYTQLNNLRDWECNHIWYFFLFTRDKYLNVNCDHTTLYICKSISLDLDANYEDTSRLESSVNVETSGSSRRGKIFINKVTPSSFFQLTPPASVKRHFCLERFKGRKKYNDFLTYL